MRRIAWVGLLIVILTGCVNEYTLKEGADLSSDLPYYQPATMPVGRMFPLRPAYAKDNMPNSELQIKAYKSAIRDVSQFGWFVSGYSFYGYLWSDLHYARPPLYDFKTIPADSAYFYDRYYQDEVIRIRKANEWSGAILGISSWLIPGLLILL